MYKRKGIINRRVINRSVIIRTVLIIFVMSLLLQACGDKQEKFDSLNRGTDVSDNISGQTQMTQGNNEHDNNAQEDGSSADADPASAKSADANTTDANSKDSNSTDANSTDGSNTAGNPAEAANQQSTAPAIDLNLVKPNETGRIMVVMFHNFIEEYKKGDKEFTTTFGAFEELLYTLYESGYRLISMNDYLNGNIDTPAGCIPMIFTFDDGTAGQFNLIEKDGALVANPRSAVGIMEKFNEAHPDFGTKCTFYVNLGNQTFSGAGTLEQRLEYLISKGFELGNHTYTHISLKEAKTAAKIQEEIGGNQKKMYELVPGYAFATFSLPYGELSKDLAQYVVKGEFEGVRYENRGIMKVGSDPAPSPFSINFDPLSTQRVRAPGITPVNQDLTWWLNSMKRDRQFISDGDASVVTVPESHIEYVNQGMLNGRKLVTY